MAFTCSTATEESPIGAGFPRVLFPGRNELDRVRGGGG